MLLDSVQTLLARWAFNHRSSISPTSWNPSLPNEEIPILLSKSEFGFQETGNKSFILCVCQNAMHQHLDNHGIDHQDLPSSTALVALLLSYPAVRVFLEIIKTRRQILRMKRKRQEQLRLSHYFHLRTLLYRRTLA